MKVKMKVRIKKISDVLNSIDDIGFDKTVLILVIQNQEKIQGT